MARSGRGGQEPREQVREAETRAERARVAAMLRELDQAREAALLTKAALAARAGIPEDSVRKLFSSRTANPSLTTLNRLARALGLRVSLTKQD